MKQEPGSWMDDMGCCKMCGGEIPHGHSSNCDVYKMDMQIRELKADKARLDWCATHSLDVRDTTYLTLTREMIDEGMDEYETRPDGPKAPTQGGGGDGK